MANSDSPIYLKDVASGELREALLADASGIGTERSAMNYVRSKEWTLRMAAIEEECGCDISAGKPIFYPPSITGWTPPVKPKPTRKPKTRAATCTAKPARKRRATTAKARG